MRSSEGCQWTQNFRGFERGEVTVLVIRG